MDKDTMLRQDRLFWVQRPNSNVYNDGEYKWKLSNDKVVGVGDMVLVKFSNGNFRGVVKQTAGFGWKEDRAVIMIQFPGKSKGKKVHIDNVIDKL